MAAADLFGAAGLEEDAPRPLADRLRPRVLGEVVDQSSHSVLFGDVVATRCTTGQDTLLYGARRFRQLRKVFQAQDMQSYQYKYHHRHIYHMKQLQTEELLEEDLKLHTGRQLCRLFLLHPVLHGYKCNLVDLVHRKYNYFRVSY